MRKTRASYEPLEYPGLQLDTDSVKMLGLASCTGAVTALGIIVFKESVHELQHLAWGGLSSLDIRRSAAEDVVPRLLLLGRWLGEDVLSKALPINKTNRTVLAAGTGLAAAVAACFAAPLSGTFFAWETLFATKTASSGGEATRIQWEEAHGDRHAADKGDN
eukprot:jgi/Tetstr1/428245/TSEL_018285.t1